MAKLQDNTGTSGYFDSYFIYSNNSVIAYATGQNFGTDANVRLSYTGTSVVLKIDTNRDGIDIDVCRNVRVSNCTINSPEDDALCLKSSYALGPGRGTENVTITNCIVSGFAEGMIAASQKCVESPCRLARASYSTFPMRALSPKRTRSGRTVLKCRRAR